MPCPDWGLRGRPIWKKAARPLIFYGVTIPHKYTCLLTYMALTGNDILEALSVTADEVSEDPSLNALYVLNEIVDGMEALSSVA